MPMLPSLDRYGGGSILEREEEHPPPLTYTVTSATKDSHLAFRIDISCRDTDRQRQLTTRWHPDLYAGMAEIFMDFDEVLGYETLA